MVKKGFTLPMYSHPPERPQFFGKLFEATYGTKFVIKELTDTNGWVIVLTAAGLYRVSANYVAAYSRVI